jgi:hypothetical protein
MKIVSCLENGGVGSCRGGLLIRGKGRLEFFNIPEMGDVENAFLQLLSEPKIFAVIAWIGLTSRINGLEHSSCHSMVVERNEEDGETFIRLHHELDERSVAFSHSGMSASFLDGIVLFEGFE